MKFNELEKLGEQVFELCKDIKKEIENEDNKIILQKILASNIILGQDKNNKNFETILLTQTICIIELMERLEKEKNNEKN